MDQKRSILAWTVPLWRYRDGGATRIEKYGPYMHYIVPGIDVFVFHIALSLRWYNLNI